MAARGVRENGGGTKIGKKSMQSQRRGGAWVERRRRTYNYTDSHARPAVFCTAIGANTSNNPASIPPKEPNPLLGLHLTADLYDCRCDPMLLTDTARLRTCCVGAVQAAGLMGVAQLFHDFSSASAPGSGITGVVLLAESHLAVHTWPERAGVTLDVYVCNYSADNTDKAHALLEALLRAFAPARRDTRELKRGGA
jgi:S-adenosylmethionine decarboxylase